MAIDRERTGLGAVASRRLRLDRSGRPLLAALWMLAFAIRLAPVLHSGGLFGLHGYDDGVYFSAADALSRGLLPYRDFLFLHPPGIVLALVPFAAIGSLIGDPSAFALARLAMIALGATNAVLVALVAGRHRRLAGLVAGTIYAVWSTAAIAEQTIDLHTLQNALMLAALLAIVRPGRIGPRRAAFAGAAVGLACGVQVWQGVSLAVLLWWVVVRAPGAGWRRLLPAGTYLLAAGLGLAVITIPFLVVAVAPMLREVIVDQLTRPDVGAAVLDRIRVLEGLARIEVLPSSVRAVAAAPIVLLAAFAAAFLTVATAWRFTWTRPWAVLAFADAVVLLLTPSFFDDYRGLLAPAASLVLGTGLAAIAETARGRGLGRRVVDAVLAAGLTTLAVVSVVWPGGDALPLSAIESDIASVQCVASDSPALLVLTATLQRDITARCPVIIDPNGVAFDDPRVGQGQPSAANWRYDVPAFQLAMTDWYGGAGATLFDRLAGDMLTPETMRTIERRLPVGRQRGPVLVAVAISP